MKRIQSIITALMMVVGTGELSDNFTPSTVFEVVPIVNVASDDEIFEESRTPEVTTSLTTTMLTTTSTTTTTRKETTITTTTTTVVTTTTEELPTTTEEVVPIAVEETFNEEIALEESIENYIYSTGEWVELDSSSVEKSWNRAEWDETWLPGFASTIEYTNVDLQALYNIVEHETSGCSARHKQIITSAIINRVIYGWGSSIYDVLTAPGQFSGVWSYVDRTDYATQDTIDCVNYVLATGIDFADGGIMFYNPTYCGYMEWFESHELVAEIEGHRIFR